MDTPVGFFEALKPDWSALRGAAAAPVNRFVTSGAEYTPLAPQCQQYIVVLFVLGAIECTLGRRLTRIWDGFPHLPPVPVLDKSNW
jgi:hypothetical protein